MNNMPTVFVSVNAGGYAHAVTEPLNIMRRLENAINAGFEQVSRLIGGEHVMVSYHPRHHTEQNAVMAAEAKALDALLDL